MHSMFFGIKRAHLSMVAIARRLLEFSWLTPARFDLMRILKLRPDGTQQAAVQWLLGVAAPTVSRMLKSLEELGFVVRTADPRDRRCKIVHLTKMGVDEVEFALEMTVHSREADRLAAQSTRGDDRIEPPPSAVVDQSIREAACDVATCEDTLDRIRKTFHDRAPFRHPWRTQYVTPVFTEMVDGMLCYGVPFTGAESA